MITDTQSQEMLEEIKTVYDQYSHLNKLLSDSEWLPKDFTGTIIFDLWEVISEIADKLNEANTD